VCVVVDGKLVGGICKDASTAKMLALKATDLYVNRIHRDIVRLEADMVQHMEVARLIKALEVSDGRN
jgi:hypothetical protein